VSVPKAVRLPDDLSAVDLLFTNADEARAMLCETSESLECLTAGLRHRGAKSVVLTLGSDGHLVADATGSYQFEAIPAETVDVTGAGDALMAGTLCGFMQGKALAEASIVGAVLAHLTVQSPLDVPADLSPALLEAATNTSPPATVTRLT
jgi:pseudouridine kinase